MNPLSLPSPTVLLVAGVAWLASLVAVGYWQNDAGHVAERVGWQEKDNKELRLANAKITELNNRERTKERESAERLAAVSDNYQRELKNAKDQRERDVSAARAGTLKLQFNPASVSPGGSEAGSTAASAGRCDGAATSELPREITANLFALADDADEVVKQLSACQAVVRSDRKLPLP